MSKLEKSIRAEFITRRTYCRPIYDEAGEIQRFETWEDIVNRVIEHQKWLWERAKGFILDGNQLEELNELRNLMLEGYGVLSGRCLWLGGTELSKQRESSLFNCVKNSTTFITTEGTKTFSECNVGDNYTVLTHTGEWKNATVISGGIQDLFKIKFTRGTSNAEIEATAKHTWILANNTRTNNLSVGDKIISPTSNFENWNYYLAEIDEKFWWCYGFVFGDGTIVKNPNYTSSMVRLCGRKADYLERFKECNFAYSFPPSCNEDPVVYTGKYTKTLPEAIEDSRLLTAFVHGYLAADGGKNVNYLRAGYNQYDSLQASGLETIKFIETVFPKIGIYLTSIKEITKDTNFGKRTKPTKFYRLNAGLGKAANLANYKVQSIEYSSTEEVFCLQVEEDHSFVLSNGIVTGNCSGTKVETVYDVVDVFWLLLQGCGVGFKPVRGTLNGFFQPIKNIEVIRSTKKPGERGRETTVETIEDNKWTIQIGDSAEAWAKSIGKLLAGKHKVDTLILDFSEIRCAGERLKGYGWVSSGDSAISKAYVNIAELLSKKAGQLLSIIDIMDIINHLGTVLSSRRSAEICLVDADDYESEAFALAKKNFWENGNAHRAQSNNSLVFYNKPSRQRLEKVFKLMQEAGGSEPGFINGETASKRAPWFSTVNPCAEILLGNKSFCNLVTIFLHKFKDNNEKLYRALYIFARANYRQTLVNLEDGILQEAWHLNNEFLRLCGVNLTGIVMRDDLIPYDYRTMERLVTAAAYSMADELGKQRPKNITTIQPSGTLSKCFDSTEGVHKPPGKYIFNNVIFSKYDESLPLLRAANYRIIEHPFDEESVIVTFPVSWESVKFDEVNGVEVNLESAVSQLERYKMLQINWTQQNTSVTISYSPEEVPQIIDWLLENWDIYVGVSFLYRTDPTKTAKDLGYAYLPQEVVTKETYNNYVETLEPLQVAASFTEIENQDCAGGVCPIK